jgi:hypothetical protein
MTAVSNSFLFTTSNTINNGLGVSANVSNLYSVLIISDVTKTVNFSTASASQTVVGVNSAANGIPLLITNPDLVRETGRVMYIETSNTVIERSINSSEEIRLVLKF